MASLTLLASRVREANQACRALARARSPNLTDDHNEWNAGSECSMTLPMPPSWPAIVALDFYADAESFIHLGGSRRRYSALSFTRHQIQRIAHPERATFYVCARTGFEERVGMQWSESFSGAEGSVNELMVFDMRMCGRRLQGSASTQTMRIATTYRCLGLPTPLFARLKALLNATCSTVWDDSLDVTDALMCEFSQPVASLRLPSLSFRLSETGLELFVPLESLFLRVQDNTVIFCIEEIEVHRYDQLGGVYRDVGEYVRVYLADRSGP